MKIFSLLLLMFLGGMVYGQNADHQSATHIFWDANHPLSPDDFNTMEQTTEQADSLCKNSNLCWGAYTGLFSILDAPKKRRKRGKLLEKVYFAPAFDKIQSYKLNDDVLQFQKQALVFDLYELAARFARKELQALLNNTVPDAYGTRIIFFETAKASANKYLAAMVHAYTQDAYVKNKEGAYEEWKIKIAEQLEAHKEFETSKEEQQRFITGAPLDKEYEMAETVMGNMFKD